jgi:hypothetical protein
VSDGAARALGRAAAATGALCVGVHLATAAAGGHGGAVAKGVLVAMAAACLPCVLALWRDPGVRVWRSTGLMYGGMLFVHLVLLSAGSGRYMHMGHAVDTGTMAATGTWTEAGMWGGVALAALQVSLAGTVLATGRARGSQRGAVGVRSG